MNAEDRGTRPATGQNPWTQASASTPPSVTPASGANPQRTSLRSGQIPSRPVTGETPTTGSAAAEPRSGGNVFAPAPAGSTRSAAPAASRSTAPASAGATATAAQGTASGETETAFGTIKSAPSRSKVEVRPADPAAASKSKGGPRKVRALVSRVDPWSALKIGFLLSIAVGIMLVVAVYVLWNVLNTMGIFTTINDWILTLFPEDSELDLMQFFDLNKIMAATTLIAVVDVVLLTALATISAFLYNVISAVVGGFYVTLTDD
ncbi:DUF3566 domain-containing protein [Demequina salsinemoris]|uniref:DUF3566 domain-containing protein n=1 Tax=Demequina salsinemoris TaxID=577470 RepID=UPI000A00095F|nr:DUF3566 domain-containing protein [Demequina salsinemoris]